MQKLTFFYHHIFYCSRQTLTRTTASLLFIPLLFGCEATLYQTRADLPENAKIRFLLTFDDGPSGSSTKNPTLTVLDTLKRNSVQPDIKAVFFIQSRDPRVGGSKVGKKLIQREHKEGHLLAVHSGSFRGHVSHTKMNDTELRESLTNNIDDIQQLTGLRPTLVRPTNWLYDDRTVKVYQRTGLTMMLTDVRTFDGKIRGYKVSIRRRSSMRGQLKKVHKRMAQNLLPIVDGIVPVIVTFHDINTYTAKHMDEYLRIIVEESARINLPISDPPFYNRTDELREAAVKRAALYMADYIFQFTKRNEKK
jgi:peptidoglycan/xylan/chitin deacetylase (PgdA/CDA1 family)